MLKNCVFIFFLLIFTLSKAQDKSWHHWHTGCGMGLSFDAENKREIFKWENCWSTGLAEVSHPVTGEFLFLTEGFVGRDKTWSTSLPTYFNSLNNRTGSAFTFIVPDPAKFLRYYVFKVDNRHQIQFGRVDMTINAGKGDITDTMVLLRSQADHHYTAVKQLYNNGYWLITHTMGTDEFQVFSITKDGISLTPIISNAGQQSYGNNSREYGNLISDKNGSTLVHCFGTTGKQAKADILDFDKTCGKVQYRTSVYPDNSSSVNEFSYAALSNSDNYLYISWYGAYYKAGNGIYRYNMHSASPDNTRKLLGVPQGNVKPFIALAPDEKIYITMSETDKDLSWYASVLHDADKPSAHIIWNEVNLYLGSGYYGVYGWPAFIMDWSKPKIPGVDAPKINLNGGCTGETTIIEVLGTYDYDSLTWEISGGKTIRKKSFSHVFANSGNSKITFTWYLCGIKYQTEKTVDIQPESSFTLGEDTILCHGDKLLLEGPPDNSFYFWSTGESTSSITIDRSGLYFLSTGTEYCFSTDTILINYHPSVRIYLGMDQYICEDMGEMVKLDAGDGFISYKWYPTEDTSQWIIVQNTGDYFVIVEDFNGCKGKEGVSVNRLCPVYLEMPNAFSPNNDGLNDVLRPVFSDVTQYRLEIYNRWGELIFLSENPEFGWDGTFRGKNVQSGLYFYKLSYKGYDGKRFRKLYTSSTLQLMR